MLLIDPSPQATAMHSIYLKRPVETVFRGSVQQCNTKKNHKVHFLVQIGVHNIKLRDVEAITGMP